MDTNLKVPAVSEVPVVPAVIYFRVSTDEQINGYSLETQLKACRQYSSQNGLTVIAEIDDDYTGFELDRPGFNRVRRMVERREVRALVVFNQDRLTRNLAHLLILREQFQRAGVELHCCDRGKSEDTAEARMAENILGVFSEYRRERIMEESKRGRRGKLDAGQVIGNGQPRYGYRNEGKKKQMQLVICEDEAKIVRLIFIWFVYGAEDSDGPLEVIEICDRLTAMGVPTCVARRGTKAKKRRAANDWIPGLVYPILRAEMYTGTWFAYQYKVVKVDGKKSRKRRPRSEWVGIPIPAIIDREVWEAAQTRLKRGRHNAREVVHWEYLMRGRLMCKCGYHVSGKPCHAKRKLYLYYYCNGRWPRITARRCSLPAFTVQELDATVWQWIEKAILDPVALGEGLAASRSKSIEENRGLIEELEIVEKNIAANRDEEAMLMDLYLKKTFPLARVEAKAAELRQMNERLERERDDIQARLAKATISDEQIKDIQELADVLREELSHGDLDFASKRRMVELLDCTGELWVEDGERVIYATCIIDAKRLVIRGLLQDSATR
jgi:site-specific DNA recombinase